MIIGSQGGFVNWWRIKGRAHGGNGALISSTSSISLLMFYFHEIAMPVSLVSGSWQWPSHRLSVKSITILLLSSTEGNVVLCVVSEDDSLLPKSWQSSLWKISGFDQYSLDSWWTLHTVSFSVSRSGWCNRIVDQLYWESRHPWVDVFFHVEELQAMVSKATLLEVSFSWRSLTISPRSIKKGEKK